MAQKRGLTTIAAALVVTALIVLTVLLMVGTALGTGILDMQWWTIDGGGTTFSTGGTYSLGGTSGQPDAGRLSGGQFNVVGGFWGGAGGPVSTSTGTPNVPTGTTTPTTTATAAPGGTSTASPTVCSLQFSDVPSGSTFYSYVRCMACRGIINGYSSGCGSGNPCFRPGHNVTRGQLAKIVSNSAGFSEQPGDRQFEDVPAGSTFFDFIWRLANRGYIGGYPCGGTGEPCGPGNLPYFRPQAEASRGQISKIVSNAVGYQDPPGDQIFEDVPAGSTFYHFIQRLASRGVMAGYACGGAGEPCYPPANRPYFRPANNATRGQTSKIVANTFFPNCQTP